VVDPKGSQSYHPFAFHKMTGPEEDLPEVEDFPEVEDSLEEADTQVAVEYHLEDHQEEVGDHHRLPYHKHNKEN